MDWKSLINKEKAHFTSQLNLVVVYVNVQADIGISFIIWSAGYQMLGINAFFIVFVRWKGIIFTTGWFRMMSESEIKVGKTFTNNNKENVTNEIC